MQPAPQPCLVAALDLAARARRALGERPLSSDCGAERPPLERERAGLLQACGLRPDGRAERWECAGDAAQAVGERRSCDACVWCMKHVRV